MIAVHAPPANLRDRKPSQKKRASFSPKKNGLPRSLLAHDQRDRFRIFVFLRVQPRSFFHKPLRRIFV